MGRVYFIGAGASVADGFPVTKDLMAAVAYAVQHGGPRDAHSRRLFGFLHTAYAVPRQTLASASRAWGAFVENGARIRSAPLPSIIEMLSVLDVICQEGMNLGPAARRKRVRGARAYNFDSIELRRVRDRVQTALIEQFDRLQERRRSVTFDRFAETLAEDDVVITTNWDLLLDRTLDERFGPPGDGTSFGTPLAGFERPAAERRASGGRVRKGPWLLKLHGSLNWLWCTQCGGLTIDRRRRRPSERTATHDDPFSFRCPCGGQFTGLIVTPTFLKRYENHHVGGVWTAALQSPIHATDWTFIGYSLPEDDVAVRALLLKALVSNRRAVLERRPGVKPVQVRLVMWSKTGSPEPGTLARYRQLFGSALQGKGYWGGFAKWVGR
jgi:NAD-dependent SIR2 family protein deacetylase